VEEGAWAIAGCLHSYICFSVLVCAELPYTNSQIWFIRFDVDQCSKLVCVGNQAGEVFVWALIGTEFVQVPLQLRAPPAALCAHALQVSTCSSKKFSACVRQTALAATGARPWQGGCVCAMTR